MYATFVHSMTKVMSVWFERVSVQVSLKHLSAFLLVDLQTFYTCIHTEHSGYSDIIQNYCFVCLSSHLLAETV